MQQATCAETSASTAADTTSDDNLQEFSSILRTIENSRDEYKIEEAEHIIFQNESIKNSIYENINSKIAKLHYDDYNL